MSELETAYRQRFENVLTPVADLLKAQIKDIYKDEPRIDRVVARAKTVNSFLEKSKSKEEDGTPKYLEPLRQIQDQIGARIIVYYLNDIDRICKIAERYYRKIESRHVVPESESEFGYFGTHFVFHIPSDVIDQSIEASLLPVFFELQVKTLFQHAWSEANHDLGYKTASGPLSPETKRFLAYASAQAWGADHVFNRLARAQEGLELH